MSSQEYISLFNNDVDAVAKDYYGLSVDIAMSIFSILLYSIALFKINFYMAIVAISANLVSVAVPFILKNSVNHSRQNYLETMKKYNNKLSDAIIGHITVKIYNLKDSIIGFANVASKKNLNGFWNIKKEKH